MKRTLYLISVAMLTLTLQGCAIYPAPYGVSAGYYGYAPYYGFGINYWPHSYYSYRPYYGPGFRPGYRSWGGGHYWSGRGGWRGR
jgi:hypothetical protein